MKKILFTIFIFSLFIQLILPIDITASGGWTELIDSTDLVSGAGSNLISTYESATNATIINISNSTGPSDEWRVDVYRSDVLWDSNLILFVRRTSDGEGLGSISGGTTYTSVETLSKTFFSGTGDRSNINIQYKLEGMSIQIPPGNYSTNIVFTLVDI